MVSWGSEMVYVDFRKLRFQGCFGGNSMRSKAFEVVLGVFFFGTFKVASEKVPGSFKANLPKIS